MLSKSLERTLFNSPINFWVQKALDIPVLLKWAKIPKKASILEIGCGNGKVACFLSEKLKTKNFDAIDIDPQIIATAESLLPKNSNVIFQVANTCKLPFPDSSFDAVIELNALHHIADWKRAINQIKRVLKKDGKLLLRDFGIEAFSLPVIGLLIRSWLDNPYEHMYDQKELMSYLRKSGFEITHQYDSSFMLMLVATLTGKKK